MHCCAIANRLRTARTRSCKPCSGNGSPTTDARVKRKFVPQSGSDKRKWFSEALRVPSDIKQPGKRQRRAGSATAPKEKPVDILRIATAQLAAKLRVRNADLLIATPPDGLCFHHTLNAHTSRDTWIGRAPAFEFPLGQPHLGH